MLALKLLLVPFFLALVSLAGRRWGPSVAGWLAGMPVVVGPILFLLSLEQGPAYAGAAAVYTVAGVMPVVAFSTAYALACGRLPWWGSLAAGYGAWLAGALLVLALPMGLPLAALLAMVALVGGPALMPRPAGPARPAALPRTDLAFRMLAGAMLTLVVTGVAATAGTRVAGLIALFPVISSVLAVFTHRANGATAAMQLLRALVRGLISLTAFCLVVAAFVAAWGTAMAFTVAAAAALAVQAALPRPRAARHAAR